MMLMLLIDVILALILLGFFIWGWQTGLIKTISSVLGIIFGILIAGWNFEKLADYLIPLLNNRDNLARILAYIIIFVAVNIIVSIIGTVITNIFKIIPLATLANKFLGGTLSLIGGILGLGFLFIMIDKFPFADFLTKYLTGSVIVPWIAKIASIIMPLLPQAVKQVKGILNI
jgi:membrane protein required for colicin V production